MDKKKVVFIIGIGRSGSTMLDCMIGSHPSAFSLGEVSKIANFKKTPRKPWSSVSDFWETRFTPAEKERLYQAFSNARLREAVPLKIEKIYRNFIGEGDIFSPYTFLHEKIGKPILIDSSKYHFFVSPRLEADEFKSGALDVYVIHMVRDARAVLNSYVRAYPDRTVDKIARKWNANLSGALAIYDRFPENRRLEVRYEELATDPDGTLQRVCDLLGLDWRPEMKEFWRHEHHLIAGSLGVLAQINRYRGEQINQSVSAVHGSYYKDKPMEIRLDTRWERELAPEKLAEFYQLTNNRNRPYEWNPAEVS
ncbi:MAG: sulfotransferase [Cyanobacteria bacterium P01_H01_bin.15]